jgi:hypothetical protein
MAAMSRVCVAAVRSLKNAVVLDGSQLLPEVQAKNSASRIFAQGFSYGQVWLLRS